MSSLRYKYNTNTLAIGNRYWYIHLFVVIVVCRNDYEPMTDMSSSGSAPSPVVCPLAKLGRLSPSNVRLPYGSSPIANRRFKSTSSESLDYKSTSPPPHSDYVCCPNRNTYSLRYADPPSYNQQPATVFYADDDDDDTIGGEKDDFFRTTLTSPQDRASPYLDQGKFWICYQNRPLEQRW